MFARKVLQWQTVPKKSRFRFFRKFYFSAVYSLTMPVAVFEPSVLALKVSFLQRINFPAVFSLTVPVAVFKPLNLLLKVACFTTVLLKHNAVAWNVKKLEIEIRLERCIERESKVERGTLWVNANQLKKSLKVSLTLSLSFPSPTPTSFGRQAIQPNDNIG